MPIQFPNFDRISFDEANPWLVGAERGQRFTQNAMMFPQELQSKMLANQLDKVKAKYAEPLTQTELEKAQLFNKYYGPDIQSQIGLRGAQTNKMNTMTPLEATALSIKNEFGRQREMAELEKQKQMSKYYGMGGPGMGVGAKEEMSFENLVSKDNPQLRNDPQKVYEAANVLRSGGNRLSDGTQLNPISPAATESLNRLTKYGTTSSLVSQNIQAQQAEAEMPILNKYINEGIKPYGTTVFGTSPLQIKDALNLKDHAAQERLGKYMGAQQLLYDRGALTLKMNALPAGVKIADEIKKLSYQSINEQFPTMSAEARQVASDTVAKALTEALKARKSVPVGASTVLPGFYERRGQENNSMSSMSDEELQRIVAGG